MDCKLLECGCIVSCVQKGGVIHGCSNSDCNYLEWRREHRACLNCGLCNWCGKCECPERFGI